MPLHRRAVLLFYLLSTGLINEAISINAGNTGTHADNGTQQYQPQSAVGQQTGLQQVAAFLPIRQLLAVAGWQRSKGQPDAEATQQLSELQDALAGVSNIVAAAEQAAGLSNAEKNSPAASPKTKRTAHAATAVGQPSQLHQAVTEAASLLGQAADETNKSAVPHKKKSKKRKAASKVSSLAGKAAGLSPQPPSVADDEQIAQLQQALKEAEAAVGTAEAAAKIGKTTPAADDNTPPPLDMPNTGSSRPNAKSRHKQQQQPPAAVAAAAIPVHLPLTDEAGEAPSKRAQRKRGADTSLPVGQLAELQLALRHAAAVITAAEDAAKDSSKSAENQAVADTSNLPAAQLVELQQALQQAAAVVAAAEQEQAQPHLSPDDIGMPESQLSELQLVLAGVSDLVARVAEEREHARAAHDHDSPAAMPSLEVLAAEPSLLQPDLASSVHTMPVRLNDLQQALEKAAALVSAAEEVARKEPSTPKASTPEIRVLSKKTSQGLQHQQKLSHTFDALAEAEDAENSNPSAADTTNAPAAAVLPELQSVLSDVLGVISAEEKAAGLLYDKDTPSLKPQKRKSRKPQQPVKEQDQPPPPAELNLLTESTLTAQGDESELAGTLSQLGQAVEEANAIVSEAEAAKRGTAASAAESGSNPVHDTTGVVSPDAAEQLPSQQQQQQQQQQTRRTKRKAKSQQAAQSPAVNLGAGLGSSKDKSTPAHDASHHPAAKNAGTKAPASPLEELEQSPAVLGEVVAALDDLASTATQVKGKLISLNHTRTTHPQADSSATPSQQQQQQEQEHEQQQLLMQPLAMRVNATLEAAAPSAAAPSYRHLPAGQVTLEVTLDMEEDFEPDACHGSWHRLTYLRKYVLGVIAPHLLHHDVEADLKSCVIDCMCDDYGNTTIVIVVDLSFNPREWPQVDCVVRYLTHPLTNNLCDIYTTKCDMYGVWSFTVRRLPYGPPTGHFPLSELDFDLIMRPDQVSIPKSFYTHEPWHKYQSFWDALHDQQKRNKVQPRQPRKSHRPYVHKTQPSPVSKLPFGDHSYLKYKPKSRDSRPRLPESRMGHGSYGEEREGYKEEQAEGREPYTKQPAYEGDSRYEGELPPVDLPTQPPMYEPDHRESPEEPWQHPREFEDSASEHDRDDPGQHEFDDRHSREADKDERQSDDSTGADAPEQVSEGLPEWLRSLLRPRHKDEPAKKPDSKEPEDDAAAGDEPRNSEDDPRSSGDAPRKSDDKPRKSEDGPWKSEDDANEDEPRESEDRPWRSEHQPKDSEDEPRSSEDEPRRSEDAPRRSEDKPRKSKDGPWKSEDDANEDEPKKGENRPWRSEHQPWKSEGEPNEDEPREGGDRPWKSEHQPKDSEDEPRNSEDGPWRRQDEPWRNLEEPWTKEALQADREPTDAASKDTSDAEGREQPAEDMPEWLRQELKPRHRDRSQNPADTHDGPRHDGLTEEAAGDDAEWDQSSSPISHDNDMEGIKHLSRGLPHQSSTRDRVTSHLPRELIHHDSQMIADAEEGPPGAEGQDGTHTGRAGNDREVGKQPSPKRQKSSKDAEAEVQEPPQQETSSRSSKKTSSKEDPDNKESSENLVSENLPSWLRALLRPKARATAVGADGAVTTTAVSGNAAGKSNATGTAGKIVAAASTAKQPAGSTQAPEHKVSP